jgi:hypothetical protein
VIYNPAWTGFVDAQNLSSSPYHPSLQPYEPSFQITRTVLASSGRNLSPNLPAGDCLYTALPTISGNHSLTGRISRICMCKRHSPAVWAEVRCAFARFLEQSSPFFLFFCFQNNANLSFFCMSLFLPQCLTFSQALRPYRETSSIVSCDKGTLYTVAVAHPRV